MFNLSDRVRHKITGETGIVVGYGHQLINDNYLTTIKVRITSLAKGSLVVEDLFSNWLFEPEGSYILGFQGNNARLSISCSI